MIKITAFVKDEEYIGLEVSGHANFDEEGKDIICAAVSALTINLGNSIDRFCEDDYIIDSCDGFLKLTLRDRSDKSGLLLDSCILGLMNIGEEYSDYVNINLQEVK